MRFWSTGSITIPHYPTSKTPPTHHSTCTTSASHSCHMPLFHTELHNTTIPFILYATSPHSTQLQYATIPFRLHATFPHWTPWHYHPIHIGDPVLRWGACFSAWSAPHHTLPCHTMPYKFPCRNCGGDRYQSYYGAMPATVRWGDNLAYWHTSVVPYIYGATPARVWWGDNLAYWDIFVVVAIQNEGGFPN